MKSKSLSLFIVMFIYIAAFGTGTVVLFAVSALVHPLTALFIADIAATIIVFIFNLALCNASIYDPYWSVQPVFLIAMMYLHFGFSFQLKHLLVLIPLLLWSLRLTLNWAKGFENLEWEDWRYRKFKTENPKIAQFIVFTGIMMMPTILVFMGTIPFWYLLNAEKFPMILPAAGGLIILLGTVFEHLADTRMRRYKRNPGRGPYIDEGIWRHSRHPNYLGEILIWTGLFVSGMVNFQLLSLPGVFLIILLFVFISAPMMERHILEKTPEYKNYQKTVPFLIFGPRRK